MIQISEIAFSCYPVTDMARARKFYEGVLGLKATYAVGEPGGMQFTEYDIANGTLALGTGAPNRRPRADGCSVGLEVEDFDAAIAHLKANGVQFQLKAREETSAENCQAIEVRGHKPRSIVTTVKVAADKVRKLIKPAKKRQKKVIINAEVLETRVAVLEDGILVKYTVERTSEERLVGSIFKGKVRNLEDRLKAAFVDIGFEKNAFLHYWDIVPSNFDNSVEVVEREGSRKRDKPKFTQKDVPRLFPPGSDIIVQVTKGPIGNRGPRVTTNVVLPGRYLVLLPNSDQSGISRKIENHEERQRLKRILRNLTIPDGMGVIMRTVGEGQQARYFVRDLALLLEEWRDIQERIKSQPGATRVFHAPDLIERTVRDFLTEDDERIVTDSPKAYDRMREMISRISKRSADKVQLCTDHQPIFDCFGISRQPETFFTPVCRMAFIYDPDGNSICIHKRNAGRN